MNARLIIRPPVVNDLEAHAIYIGQRSPAAADRFLDSAMSDFERLAEMPGIGHLRQFRKPSAAGIRSWSVSGFPNHLIFYRPVEGGVEILRVIRGAQDIDAIFEN